MAKELPYFKFEPAEYLTKNISFCSLAAQGLFINVCSYYWQRNCNLTKNQILRRLNYVNELDELLTEGIIDIDIDFNISIKFLDIQKDEVLKTSKINSKNGALGGRPKKTKKSENKPDALIPLSEPKGIREDKIKEDDIIYTQTNFLEDWKKARLHYDKQPTNITSLKSFELINFNKILNSYGSDDFYQAINGLFFQETFKPTRLRPTHFLDNFETYLTCWQTKEKLFENKKKEIKL